MNLKQPPLFHRRNESSEIDSSGVAQPFLASVMCPALCLAFQKVQKQKHTTWPLYSKKLNLVKETLTI